MFFSLAFQLWVQHFKIDHSESTVPKAQKEQESGNYELFIIKLFNLPKFAKQHLDMRHDEFGVLSKKKMFLIL